AGAPVEAASRRLVRDERISYAKLFYTSAPDRHARAWARLNALADDTHNYYSKVLAAERIMWLYRHDPSALESEAWLQDQKNSAAEVMHTRTHTLHSVWPTDIARA